MLVSGVQNSDSVIYIFNYIYVISDFFFIILYNKMLNIVPCSDFFSFFTWLLQVLVAACGIFVVKCVIFNCGLWALSCGLRNLVPWPEIEPGPSALGLQSLNHRTREVPRVLLTLAISNRCILGSHYCFNLQFPNDIWCWTSIHMFVFHLCVSFGEMSV